MDKAQALYQFWNSFNIPAYDQSTVPEDAQMPYITYEMSEDMLDNDLLLSASIWYNSLSWEEITLKANEISRYVTLIHTPIPLDGGGYLWVKRGSPFMQRMSDENKYVRRIYINIQVEFLTAY